MKFPVLWLASVSLSVWVGTEKGVRLAWDLESRSRITLHFGAKAVKPNLKPLYVQSLNEQKKSLPRLQSRGAKTYGKFAQNINGKKNKKQKH